MAKNKDRRRAPVDTPSCTLAVLGDDMRRHVDALGFASLDAYFAWCRQHRLGTGIHKSGTRRYHELELAQRLRAATASSARVRVRNPAEAVRRLLAGDEVADTGYDDVAMSLRDVDAAPGQRALLAAVLDRLAELAPETLGPSRSGLRLALRVAEHHADVVRPLASWQLRTHNEERGLASLVQHLFARYAAPACLLDAWFADGDAAARHRRWYLHVAGGGNLRTADGLPIELTRRMAHACLEAPAALGVSGMLRYGQVRGLGGSVRLAHAIVASPLGRTFAHDDFWRTFVLFCVRHGEEDARRIGAAIDYLHEQRHGGRVVVDERGSVRELPPPQPNLSMHGRTPAALQKQVEAWHERLGRGSARDAWLRWAPSGFGGYRAVTGTDGVDACVWTVRELCSALELRHESAVMRHCVYSYLTKCMRGSSRIFTMTRSERGATTTAATIEVIDRRIVQVRAAANRPPSSAAREHLRRWAQSAGLVFRGAV